MKYILRQSLRIDQLHLMYGKLLQHVGHLGLKLNRQPRASAEKFPGGVGDNGKKTEK